MCLAPLWLVDFITLEERRRCGDGNLLPVRPRYDALGLERAISVLQQAHFCQGYRFSFC